MKILLASIIVIITSRLVFGFAILIVNLPFGIIFERWGDKAPHSMRQLRLLGRSTCLFISMIIGVLAAVIFSYYIFHFVAHTKSEIILPLISVTIPMFFSIRTDLKQWKIQYAKAWNEENDVSDDFRKNVDSEFVTIHRVGVFAKTCALVAAWIYFLLIGDQLILPYLGIK